MGCSTLRPDLEQKRLAESTEADATVGGVGILWSFGDLEKDCVTLF